MEKMEEKRMSKISITTLGNLIEFQRGYDLPKSNFVKGDVPVISSNGILGYHNEYKVKGPGITIGRSGTVGLPHYIEENFYPHNTSLYIKDFKGNSPKYIYYLLKTLGLNDRGSGSGVPTMNRNHLHPLKVSVYLDLLTQQQIVSILSSLDSKISLNNRINTELEAMAKTMYDYWFVQFDFPNAEGKPYKSSGGKMVWCEELKREVPEGWVVGELKDVTEIKYGKDHKKIQIGDIPIFGSGGIMRYGNQAIYDKNSILIPRKGSLSNLFYQNKPFWTVDTMFYTKMRIENIGRFLFYYLQTQNISSLNVGTAVPSLTTEVLNQIKIIIPSIDMLAKFEKITYSYFNLIDKNKIQNHHLSSLRDWLLPMLMNGQVKVNSGYEGDAVHFMAAEPEEKYGEK